MHQKIFLGALVVVSSASMLFFQNCSNSQESGSFNGATESSVFSYDHGHSTLNLVDTFGKGIQTLSGDFVGNGPPFSDYSLLDLSLSASFNVGLLAMAFATDPERPKSLFSVNLSSGRRDLIAENLSASSIRFIESSNPDYAFALLEPSQEVLAIHLRTLKMTTYFSSSRSEEHEASQQEQLFELAPDAYILWLDGKDLQQNLIFSNDPGYRYEAPGETRIKAYGSSSDFEFCYVYLDNQDDEILQIHPATGDIVVISNSNSKGPSTAKPLQVESDPRIVTVEANKALVVSTAVGLVRIQLDTGERSLVAPNQDHRYSRPYLAK